MRDLGGMLDVFAMGRLILGESGCKIVLRCCRRTVLQRECSYSAVYYAVYVLVRMIRGWIDRSLVTVRSLLCE